MIGGSTSCINKATTGSAAMGASKPFVSHGLLAPTTPQHPAIRALRGFQDHGHVDHGLGDEPGGHRHGYSGV
jgi:hypothetical protein